MNIEKLRAAAGKVKLDGPFAIETRDDGSIAVAVRFLCQSDAVAVPSLNCFDARFRALWGALPALLAVVEAAKGKDSLEDAAIEWDVIAQILSTQNFTPAARRCRSIAAALRNLNEKGTDSE